ncbi:MAG: GNAT family N-acetyltransferase [Oscillospiraceae bacterium]|nr:GNAT family N-acetyltransferase [Oscillospiraceae bacterium]
MIQQGTLFPPEGTGPAAGNAAGPLSFRAVGEKEREIFARYLLPDAAMLVRREPADTLLAGAVWGRAACGAAAVRLSPEREAEALSFFVDPAVRRRGVGGTLLRFTLAQCAAAGATVFRARYALEAAEQAAFDRLFLAQGASLEQESPIYILDISIFRDTALLKPAFSPEYRRPSELVPFTALTQEQREALDKDAEVPWYVRPRNRGDMRTELSLAYLADGRVAGFWLGGTSARGHYTVQGVWRSASAPALAFHLLLIAHLNLCFYHGGGDFLYYVSPATARAEMLLQRYSRGNFRRLETHMARIRL